MQPLIHIHLLGLPHILLGSARARVSELPTEKAKLLFFYLLLFRNVEHTRSGLAGLFWGNSPEGQARHALSTTLWRLRQWLKPLQGESMPLLCLEDQQIAFNTLSACWLDVAEFEEQIALAKQVRAVDPGQAAVALHRALEIYRGELLEGCYAEWCLIERNRLHELFLQALFDLMVYHTEQHEYSQAITCARRILEHDPLREEVQQELIKLLVLNREPAEAIHQYQRCASVLRKELGIPPAPETQALFRSFVLQCGTAPENLADFYADLPTNPREGLQPLLHKIDDALAHFELAREELTQVIHALQQTRIEIGQSTGTMDGK